MWFKKLTGFVEESPDQVRENLFIQGDSLYSRVNGKKWVFGSLSIPSLGELRRLVEEGDLRREPICVREYVGDVQRLHADPTNEHALFQVASQFNLLEMVAPSVTPEMGVDRYEDDLTQGPACAIAAGAGTIYRNYFVPLDGQIGQTEHCQIDCLADLGDALGNRDNRLWSMRNGYVLANEQELEHLTDLFNTSSEEKLDEWRASLRIGIQWNTEVTIISKGHRVSQAYCSALPVSYSHVPSALWEHFAVLVLEASYEAVFHAAVVNAKRLGNRTLFLTMLGGGAFGNRSSWILRAMSRALSLFKHSGLEVVIVSYGRSNSQVQQMISQLTACNEER